MKADLVLGFTKQRVPGDSSLWTERHLTKFGKSLGKAAMGKGIDLWEKRKRDLCGTGKASRMKVNHRKAGGVLGRVTPATKVPGELRT